MAEKIKFGSKQDANEQREKFEEYLSDKDDRRKKTVKLSDDAPDRVLDKARSAGFESEEAETHNAGMRELSENEREQLNRVHSNFSWKQHGFEAMRVKGALQAKGVTDWKNYYEPGEGVGGAVKTLEKGKARSAQSGAKVAMDDRRDPDDQVNQRRRQQQTRRVRGRQLDSAKEAAVTEGDADAQEFIRDERDFGESVFNIRFSESSSGVPQASGADLALLEERNQQRSSKARRMDNRRAAKITRDPLVWASAPGQYDFPGIDTVDPQAVHDRRSERAREKDRNELAPKADTLNQWADNTDQYDWPGVDTPRGLGLGGESVDLPDADGLFGSGTPGEELAAVKDDVVFRDDGFSQSDEQMARASTFDVSFDPGREGEGRGFGESDVSFAGPMFDRGVEQVRETDQREREQEMGIVPEETFMNAESAAADVVEMDDQQTLGGERADDQARLAGGETGTVETETESVVEQNSGGLMADQRDDVSSSTETEQMTPDAFQVAEGGQDTFGDFGGTDGANQAVADTLDDLDQSPDGGRY